MHPTQSIHGAWSSRWMFILAATGAAVGLGNIWKFPYIVGEHGGGAFMLVYVLCLLLVGLPLLMCEVLLGRRSRHTPTLAMRSIAVEAGVSPRWAWVGLVGTLAGFLIFTFYSVVSGWVLAYIGFAVEGKLWGAGSWQLEQLFNELRVDDRSLLIWHTLFVFSVVIALVHGVEKGLEMALRFVMPSFFVLLCMLAVYGMNSGGLPQALDFLFTFNFAALSWDSVLVAMGHAFFTLSLGMGAMMMYGSYFPVKTSITSTLIVVLVLDTLVAVLSGLAIFPLVFANDLSPDKGVELMFISLPLAFGHMPGGQLFTVVFFAMVVLAAWTSAISLLEPAVTWMMEQLNCRRILSCLFLGAAAWSLGYGALISFNEGRDWTLGGLTVFDLLDIATSSIMLPLTGFLTAIFVGWKINRSISHDELALPSEAAFKIWFFIIRYVAPLAVLVICLASLAALFSRLS